MIPVPGSAGRASRGSDVRAARSTDGDVACSSIPTRSRSSSPCSSPPTGCWPDGRAPRTSCCWARPITSTRGGTPRFLSLLILSTVMDYACGLWVARVEDPRRRKAVVALSMALNLGMLGYFKYYNFFAESLHEALAERGCRSRSGTSRSCCRSASRSTRSSR